MRTHHSLPWCFVQTLYVFSPTLVPPARDWHSNVSVVGPLVPAASKPGSLEPATAEQVAATEGLPEELKGYITAAK